MKTIEFSISDKLYKQLLYIKYQEEKKEKKTISLNDLIEEAIIKQYNINLYELNKFFDEENEDLNIQINFAKLLVIALNNTKNKTIAASKMKIGLKTLHRKLHEFNIKIDKEKKIYYICK